MRYYEREKFISQFPRVDQEIGIQRSELKVWKGDNNKRGYTEKSPYSHLKDVSLAQGVGNHSHHVLKGPDGYVRLNLSGDLKDDGGRIAWVRAISHTVGGPVIFFQGRPQDNYGVRVDELYAAAFWLNKIETVYEQSYGEENPHEVAFLTTEKMIKNTQPGQINRGWSGITQIERAISINEQGTHFEGRGVVIQAEKGEILYDPSPFVDKDGKKKIVFVSKKGNYGEICVVTSANDTWDDNDWIDRQTIVKPQDVLSHHDEQRYNPDDFEWNLENPRISIIPHGRNKYVVISLTAFYPPPVERSFRQHSVLLVANSLEGPYSYGGVATVHQQAGLENFRSGEAGGLSQWYPYKNKYIAFQHSKAYGFPDAQVEPGADARYNFQGGYQNPSWQVEVLRVQQQALGLWTEALLHTLSSSEKTK